MSDLARFRDLLGDVPVRDDAASLRLKSRDFFWFSPILREELGALAADLVVMPRDETDVLAVLQAAAATDMPLTPRGGGTCNYGQEMPISGGAIFDLSALEGI
ncbi:MAG: FAD-binding protein, partial [Rhodospirillales bacterium]